MSSSFRTAGGSPPSYTPVDPRYSNNTLPTDETTPLIPRSPKHTIRSFMRHIFFILIAFLSGIVTFSLFQRYHRLPTYIPPTPILTTWINLAASPNCTSISTRTYTAHLPDMPEGFHPRDSCSDIPITIHGRTIEHPFSCYSELTQCPRHNSDDGVLRTVPCTITRGQWVVDFDEGGCVPTWDPVPAGTQNPVPDSKCMEYKTRGYSAFMSPSRVPLGLDPHQSCMKTPVTIEHRSLLPEGCHLERTSAGEEVYRARFVVNNAKTCTPYWNDIQRDSRCERYNLKKFWGIMHEVKDLDGLEACKQVPHNFFGLEERTPNWCERDEALGRIRGHWYIDFNVPECRPVFKETWDHGCVESNVKRVEARLEYNGEQDELLRMCATTPLRWSGSTYYATRCKFGDIGVFNIYDPHCP
ncbi:hypothetical protein AAF712_008930 [Marasmius tenuissimus]|uniref:Uncharacterized protein n=1 Tax=Marasmius tenuissimus TaxID=585030 RepID=A0ABR2ZS23_9AGAR